MAKFVVAGIADCPVFARVELLAEDMSKRLPNFDVHKIMIHSCEWREWLEQVCRTNNWTHSSSPLIWRELIDRGGKGLYLGGATEFEDYVNFYYNIKLDFDMEYLRGCAAENLRERVKEDGKMAARKAAYNPYYVCISKPCTKTAYCIIQQILCGHIFSDDYQLCLRLLANEEDFDEELQGLEAEMMDMCSPTLREVVITRNAAEAFQNCSFIVLLDCMLPRETAEETVNWIIERILAAVDEIIESNPVWLTPSIIVQPERIEIEASLDLMGADGGEIISIVSRELGSEERLLRRAREIVEAVVTKIIDENRALEPAEIVGRIVREIIGNSLCLKPKQMVWALVQEIVRDSFYLRPRKIIDRIVTEVVEDSILSTSEQVVYKVVEGLVEDSIPPSSEEVASSIVEELVDDIIPSIPDEDTLKEIDAEALWSFANIFKQYGKIMQKAKMQTAKILIVGTGPVNVAATVLLFYATNVPKENIVFFSKETENIARSLVASELSVHASDVRDVIVWGNLNVNEYADVSTARVYRLDSAIFGPDTYSRPVLDVLYDKKWLQHEFQEKIKKCREAVLGSSGGDMCLSVDVLNIMKLWWNGRSQDGHLHSLGVISSGQYGVSNGLGFSFPVQFNDGRLTVKEDLPLSLDVRRKLVESILELKRQLRLALPYLKIPSENELKKVFSTEKRVRLPDYDDQDDQAVNWQ